MVRVWILLLAISLGTSFCKPLVRTHYDDLAKEEEKKPSWKKRALVIGSAALISVGGWRLAKYLDHVLGRGIMKKLEDAALASRKATPMFYKGNLDKPPLYKLIAPDGSEHWLLGTMHTTGISLDDFPANSKVFEAMDESTAVLFEVNAESVWQLRKSIAESLRIQLSFRAENFNLRAALGDTYMDKLLDQFSSTVRLDLTLQGIDLEKFSPTKAHFLLEGTSLATAFGQPGAAMDVQLMRRARQAGKRVVTLETGKVQAEIVKRSAEIEVPVEQLRKFIDDGGIEGRAKKLLEARDAYGQGDIGRVDDLLDITPDLKKFMFDDRNLEWVKKRENSAKLSAR